jgi:hypothetical protein
MCEKIYEEYIYLWGYRVFNAEEGEQTTLMLTVEVIWFSP